MSAITRHDVQRKLEDVDDSIAFDERSISRIEQQLNDGRDPITLLTGLASNGQTLAQFAGAIIDDHLRTLRGFRISADAVVALFRLAAHPGVATQFSIEDHAYSIVVPGQHRSAGPKEWFLGFSAASAIRHTADFNELATIPHDVLEHSQMSMRWSSYTFPLVHALQALGRRDANANALLLTARDEASRFDGDAGRRALVIAEIDLAIHLHEANAPAFNDALERALVAHRTFWTTPANPDDMVQDRANYPDGFLALLPLGLACIAHDRGIPVEVESDYIPRWIIAP